MKLRGSNDCDDDEVEEKIEVRWCEARKDEIPDSWSFVKDEM
jgi:hypothetical protein